MEENYGCNCRLKTGCTMQNKSLTAQVVHEAEITNSTDAVLKTSYGLTETTFKEDTENIKTLFNKIYCLKDTKLSKFICLLKDQNKTPFIKQSIVKRVNSRTKLNHCK